VVLIIDAIKFIELPNKKFNFSQNEEQKNDEEFKEPDYSSCRSSSVNA
jgi:hypothetical protein